MDTGPAHRRGLPLVASYLGETGGKISQTFLVLWRLSGTRLFPNACEGTPTLLPSIPALLRCFGALLLYVFFGTAAVAQTQPATLSGHVTDASGALIPGTRLVLSCVGAPEASAVADSAGRYSFSVELTGNCTLAATMEGFAPFRSTPFTLVPGRSRTLDVKLAVADVQRVDVAPETGDATDPAANGDSTVLKGKALDDLPLDTSELQQQLNSLAGGDSPELRIDGFTGGQLPPKNMIREIRINQNPYSAQNDTNPNAGYIEIFTRPGGKEFHGDVYAYGNDSSFNSISPLLTQAPPPYHSYGSWAEVNGPLAKHASFFLSNNINNSTSNSIIKAVDPANNLQFVTQAVADSDKNNSYSARVDASIGAKSTVIIRYDGNLSSEDNGGIGNLSLPSQGYSSGTMRQTLQISNSQIITKNIVNDTRFQYIRTRAHQTPVSTLPAVVVQGSFNNGGNNTGSFHDNTDRYELQSYTSVAAGKHFLNFGVRYRDLRDANNSTANYNGQFIFASLAQYQAGSPSQYSVTFGTPGVAVNVADVGVYLQDDWKPRANLTISPGLRYESQNHISDHADWAPRMGVAYSFGGKKGKPAKYVFRGGAGLFYTRFQSSNVLQAARQNGVTQKQYVLNTPGFFDPNFRPQSLADVQAKLPGSMPVEVSSTTFQISPAFRSPRMLVTGLSVQRLFGQAGSVTASYAYSRGQHQQITRNINAPLPGTYDPSQPSSGTRPLGGTSNIYEYDSQGDYSAHRFAVNWFMNLHQKFFIYGNYQANWQNSDSWGSFPSNQYNLRVDYGRAPTPVHTLNLGAGIPLPYGFRLGNFMLWRSGRPFNITTGTDLNGDAQYNDRPAFATDLTRASVVHTAYGTFDTQPIAGQTIIPVNYGMGPSTFFLFSNLQKGFKIGPRVKPPADAKAAPPVAAGAAASAPKAPAKVRIDRKWELGLGISAQNVLNHPNYAPPVGTLSSPLFGRFLSLNAGFGPGAGSANRTVQLQTFYRF